MTDEEKSMEYTEPSQPEEWYETVEVIHGPPSHNLPADEINREQIDLTKEQEPAQERDKVIKRTKEMASNQHLKFVRRIFATTVKINEF